MDVPNGKYRVFVNIDNPSGFWGEYQVYRKRAILAQGKPVVTDTMDFDAFKKKYFRFWNVEDLPTDNTFDKYQKAYFQEKMFDVDVTDGQLNLDFQGENWGCSVSAVVIFPVAKAAEGEKFLKYVEAKAALLLRQLLQAHPAPPDRRSAASRPPRTSARLRGLPARLHEGRVLQRHAVQGRDGQAADWRRLRRRVRPVTLAVVPLQDLGKVTVTASDLTGPGGTIPAGADRRGLRFLPHHPRHDGRDRSTRSSRG